MAKKKTCFVVCPIGAEGSTERERSNEVFNHVISPAVTEKGYDPIRADKISKSGDITEQVIEMLVTAELAIADLWSLNPNVLYELAIRHVVRKPFIQIKTPEDRIPFDISTIRTIDLIVEKPSSVERVKTSIKEFIDSIEAAPSDVITPFSKAIDWMELNRSANPEQRQMAELLSRMEGLEREIRRQRQSARMERMRFGNWQSQLDPGLRPLAEALGIELVQEQLGAGIRRTKTGDASGSDADSEGSEAGDSTSDVPRDSEI